MLNIKILLVLLLAVGCSNREEQEPEQKVPTVTSFKRDTTFVNYVEYRTGNCPIVISVPHGGSLKDNSYVLRSENNCSDPDFTTVTDLYTIELANLIDSVFHARTGKYCYIIIGKIKRTYVDFNREAEYAVPIGASNNVKSYNTYHSSIRQAIKELKENFGSGFFIDLHGHGHAKKQIEIGYLLSRSELALSDDVLSSNGNYAKKSSIYHLYLLDKAHNSFAEIIRGNSSIGSIMKSYGLACVPNISSPNVGTDPYFSGGYNSKSYGSFNGLSNIDALQFEFDSESRTILNRKTTAVKFYESIYQFLSMHTNLVL